MINPILSSFALAQKSAGLINFYEHLIESSSYGYGGSYLPLDCSWSFKAISTNYYLNGFEIENSQQKYELNFTVNCC